jgi:hypothetical protein
MTKVDLDAYIDSIFERFADMPDRKLNNYIAGKRCGQCDLWKISSMCPRETPGTGKRSGYSVGPSSEDFPCKSFVPNFDFDIALQVQTMKKLES